MNDATKQLIEKDIKENPIMLYMKGTPDQPMCGFSARVVDILKQHNIQFKTFNILENEDVRSGIKEYTDWPTLPQLFVKGEFVGGCDIISEMNDSGELTKLLNN